MIAVIEDHRQAYEVEPICKVLPVAPSTDHAHAARRADPGKPPARAWSDVALLAEIRRVHEASFGVHGVMQGSAGVIGCPAGEMSWLPGRPTGCLV